MHDDPSIGGAPVVVAFEGVTIPATLSHMTGIEGISLEARGGEVVLVRVEEGRERTPLADAAEGLVTPEAGRVCFLGEDWAGMGARRQAEQRGRIRRVFEHYGWISNLDVIENICMAECHHTGRDASDVQEEAEVLARRFGLDGIPAGRPTRQPPIKLRKLEWVRAFIGAPALVILERPLFGAPRADMGRLVEAVCEVCRNGAVVMWVTDEDRVWDCGDMRSVRRFQMAAETMVAM